ncbi:class I SAM-dependent methyltransferase [Akkermansiaceae bacterium]|nr:class I SAM-dependent methyltransferase [Akkermansiaceae bacterium]
MTSLLKKIANSILRPLRLELRRSPEKGDAWPYDLSGLQREVLGKVEPFTMTTPERIAVLVDAIQHIEARRIEGDIVECGVWRGGSAMAMAETLIKRGSTERHLWLYDTFEGMSEPTEADTSYDGELAARQLARTEKSDARSVWCISPLDEVRANMASTSYPAERITLVKGKVEDTIPQTVPDRIALLRLDTDWYESTKHELEHLYPRLVPGGILIIDDYGFWQGARKAVDEYFQSHPPGPMLCRVDASARIGVKP